MAEKGKQWSDRETKLLLELWSEDSIQRQLQGAARNDAIFRRIAQDLTKSGFERTVAQIRAKIKALKKKYKAIADRMRRSGAGQESDEEEDMPADFPYFDLLHTVMGGRAAVTPVHLLDSATAREEVEPPATSEPSESSLQEVPGPSTGTHQEEDTPGPSAGSHQEEDTPGPSTSSRPATPGPSTSSRPATPGPSTSSRPATPGPSTSSRPATPGPSTSSRPATPGPSTSSRPATPGPSTSSRPTMPGPSASSRPPSPYNVEDDIPVPKKKRKRVTNIQRAEKVATSLVKDVLTAQAKEREKRAQAEKELSEREEMREKRMEDREQKFMDNMTNMMSQFLGTMMYGFPSATAAYPGASVPMNIPPPSASYPMSYSMYPYMGSSTQPFVPPTPTPPAQPSVPPTPPAQPPVSPTPPAQPSVPPTTPAQLPLPPTPPAPTQESSDDDDN